MVTIQVYPQDELPLELKAQVIAILEEVWPSGRSIAEQLLEPLHDPVRQPVAVVLVEAGRVRSYLTVPSTVIQLAGEIYKAAGLSAVATHPQYRRQGYGRQLVRAAHNLIAASDADIGVFTCDPPLVDFYVQCGWSLMAETAVIGGTRTTPFPAAQLGKCTLMDFFSEQAKARRSDFVGAALILELREGDLW